MESKHSPKVNIGSASIVVVFCVLCLTIFAVLSLITANSEAKLADKSAEAVSAYYAADYVCSEKACAIAEAAKLGTAEDTAAALGAEVCPDGNALLITYSEEISPTQALFVSLSVENGEMQVLQWQACDTDVWTFDDTIEVWDGQ